MSVLKHRTYTHSEHRWLDKWHTLLAGIPKEILCEHYSANVASHELKLLNISKYRRKNSIKREKPTRISIWNNDFWLVIEKKIDTLKFCSVRVLFGMTCNSKYILCVRKSRTYFFFVEQFQFISKRWVKRINKKYWKNPTKLITMQFLFDSDR